MKLPKGVEINGKQLRIAFTFKGKRYREPLPSVAAINKASIAYAANKRRAIQVEIKEGKFDFVSHFPDSPRAALFLGLSGADNTRTVTEGIERWMMVQRATKAASTVTNYACKARHVESRLGKRRIIDTSKSDLELFRAALLREGLSAKTVNDVFTVIRGIWADAFEDGVLKFNPLDRIRNIEADNPPENAFPFTREEIAKIESADQEHPSSVRMILFNCWTGLSISELIALAVEDVDMVAGGVHVKRAHVSGQYKVPKERSRQRYVELISPAKQLMQQILIDAAASASIDVKVIQRDNISAKIERITPLFRNPARGTPWDAKSLHKWFTAHLKKATVQHRGVNQCRHTFASQALSSFVPVEWVARQLGHTDTTMVKKHYGRWMPSDTKSMADLVSKMMGVDRGEAD
ncbi:DUF3596 domain-containing protein [Pseudomonas sp. L-22-4S-12]|uniref:Arm DNA-binding domain-containing protein n=1 Tax=Pseudomonas sp. L-22-4S-12 TaxID=2610893 RepID=UPI001325CB21|nr:DUF3596 domain-containing protein [Pseudomonas sp. L-22-4S-12]MWV17062.1 DUF3596 domain-containing protein [Pseudomonas sp. L-22-4S-12]